MQLPALDNYGCAAGLWSSSRRSRSRTPGSGKPKPVDRSQILNQSFSHAAADSDEMKKEELRHKQKTLLRIKAHRENQKTAGLHRSLRDGMTQFRTIRPAFGSLTFFEVKVQPACSKWRSCEVFVGARRWRS